MGFFDDVSDFGLIDAVMLGDSAKKYRRSPQYKIDMDHNAYIAAKQKKERGGKSWAYGLNDAAAQRMITQNRAQRKITKAAFSAEKKVLEVAGAELPGGEKGINMVESAILKHSDKLYNQQMEHLHKRNNRERRANNNLANSGRTIIK